MSTGGQLFTEREALALVRVVSAALAQLGHEPENVGVPLGMRPTGWEPRGGETAGETVGAHLDRIHQDAEDALDGSSETEPALQAILDEVDALKRTLGHRG